VSACSTDLTSSARFISDDSAARVSAAACVCVSVTVCVSVGAEADVLLALELRALVASQYPTSRPAICMNESWYKRV